MHSLVKRIVRCIKEQQFSLPYFKNKVWVSMENFELTRFGVIVVFFGLKSNNSKVSATISTTLFHGNLIPKNNF